MMTCKEVSRTIASDKLSAATWHRRLAVTLHLLMCRHCRRYAHQIQAMGEAARSLLGDSSQDPTMLQQLRNSILDQISSNKKQEPGASAGNARRHQRGGQLPGDDFNRSRRLRRRHRQLGRHHGSRR